MTKRGEARCGAVISAHNLLPLVLEDTSWFLRSPLTVPCVPYKAYLQRPYSRSYSPSEVKPTFKDNKRFTPGEVHEGGT